MLRVGLVSAVLLLAVPRGDSRRLGCPAGADPRERLHASESGTGSQGASVFVGEYYAQKRGIPPQQTLHLRIQPSESITGAGYQDAIQRPVRKYLDANDGAMRRRILYIYRPTASRCVRASKTTRSSPSIPPWPRCLSSPVLRLPNLYAQPVGPAPPLDACRRNGRPAGLGGCSIVSRSTGPVP